MIGRSTRPTGCDSDAVEVAAKTLRLYEQDATVSCIEAYLVRWRRWVRSGVAGRCGGVGQLGCAVGCDMTFGAGFDGRLIQATRSAIALSFSPSSARQIIALGYPAI